MHEPRVKICGITNTDDAVYSLEQGADIIGVIRSDLSPRMGSENLINEISSLGATVAGVYTEMENVRAIKSKEAYVQLHFPHGEKEINYVKEELGRKVISVVFANEEISPLNAGLEKVKLGADMVLLEYGRSAWDSVIEKVSDMKNLPIGVAGRVSASNLRKLLKYSPYFVDVSSSLEVIPGRKNHKKIHEFMEVIRSEGATVQQS